MKRRNFIKIATGAFLGLAAGVGLAKKKEPIKYVERHTFHMFDDLRPDYGDGTSSIANKDTRPSMNEELAKMCSDGKYNVVVVATPAQIKELKADRRHWQEVQRTVFEAYARERRGS